MTTGRKRVAVRPYLVQAARLRKTINDRLGVPTSPVTEKIAALAGTTRGLGSFIHRSFGDVRGVDLPNPDRQDAVRQAGSE